MIHQLRKGIVSLIVCAGCCVGVAASDSANPVQKVTAKDKTLILHENGREHSYEFDNEELPFAEIDTAKVLFQSRVNKELYLLLHVIGPSTGGGNGSCGAGQEQYLIWLALDTNWGKDDQKIETIASCIENIDLVSSESYVIKDGRLTSEYVELRENDQSVKNTLTYDSTKPEKGWSIERRHYAVPNSQ